MNSRTHVSLMASYQKRLKLFTTGAVIHNKGSHGHSILTGSEENPLSRIINSFLSQPTLSVWSEDEDKNTTLLWSRFYDDTTASLLLRTPKKTMAKRKLRFVNTYSSVFYTFICHFSFPAPYKQTSINTILYFFFCASYYHPSQIWRYFECTKSFYFLPSSSFFLHKLGQPGCRWSRLARWSQLSNWCW